MRLYFLYYFFLKHLILRKTERDVMKNGSSLHVNYPLFLFDLNPYPANV
jgi:hypothetical protein